MNKGDIDIDFFDRDSILNLIKHIPASRLDKDGVKKHNTGIYLHNIPVNPLTGLAAIDYEEAEQRGYFKLDFLNVHAYQGVKNEEHINHLLEVEPLWDLLHAQEICDQLVHVNGYHNLLSALNPTSIEQLAMVLALIRPGKKHLISKCQLEGFDSIRNEIWTKTDDYYFKHAHAIGYAHLVVMQLNLLCEKISYEFS